MDAYRQPGTTLEVGADSATAVQEYSLQETESVEEGSEQRIVRQETQMRCLEDRMGVVVRTVPHGEECGVSYNSGCKVCFHMTLQSDLYYEDNWHIAS